MCARGPESILRSLESMQRLIQSDIPKLDLAIPTGRQKFTLTTSLHMHTLDPDAIGFIFPLLDHCFLGSISGIEDADGAVTEASYEYVAGHLVGC